MADAATDEGAAGHDAETQEKLSRESVDQSAASPSAVPTGASKDKGQKPVSLQKPYAVILDFHGTTTPITMVKDVLLPFVKNNIERYAKDNWNNKRFKKDVHRIRKELNSGTKESPYKIKDKTAPSAEIQKSLADYVKWYVDNGKDHDAIMKMMKHIWHDAYENGSIQTPIFEDAAMAMQKWKQNGIKVFVFSSNKIDAQRQFFKQTDRGDLLPYIDGHFDKGVGSKTSSSSYAKIAKQISQPAGQLLYISDSAKEAKCASKVGMKTLLVHREGNKEIKKRDLKNFPLIYSFLDITFT